MQEISRGKRLEVAQYYLLGHTYKEIEEETGVAHGSIANIVAEVETDVLTIPGTPFDQVNDLRQLSLDLKKKNLSTSQALLGISSFERARSLGILPEYLDQWAQLASKFATADFPASDFLAAAVRFHQLEMSEGKAYDVLVEEYKRVKEEYVQLKEEASSLGEKRRKLSEEVASTSSQLEAVKKTKGKLEADVEALTAKVKELKSRVDEEEAENSRLSKEVREFMQRKTELSSEVDGKEASLTRLNDIGFLDEDLLRLRAILERIGKSTGIGQKGVKETFFAALATFDNIVELQNSQAAEAAVLKNLTKEKDLLTGEVAALEKKRGLLQGEIKESASSVMNKIVDTGQKAVLELQQQAECIEEQLDGIFAEALRVGGLVGEMKAMIKKGEESEKTLGNFIEEVQNRLGRN